MIGLHTEELDGIPVAHLPVDVDAANAGRLRDELIALVGNDALDLVLVLDRTRFLDSAGIDMLFRLSQRLSDRRARVRVVIPADSTLHRLTRIVGLEHALPTYQTLAEAIAAGAQVDDHRPEEPGASADSSGGCRSRR